MTRTMTNEEWSIFKQDIRERGKCSVIICEDCEGKGFNDERVDIGTHKSIYEYSSPTCDECKGTGRKVIYNMEFKESFDLKKLY